MLHLHELLCPAASASDASALYRAGTTTSSSNGEPVRESAPKTAFARESLYHSVFVAHCARAVRGEEGEMRGVGKVVGGRGGRQGGREGGREGCSQRNGCSQRQ